MANAAHASRWWRSTRAVRLPAMRRFPRRAALGWGVGLPRLLGALACISPSAAVVPGHPSASVALAQACAGIAARLESEAASGADCAAGGGDAREHEASEPRSHATDEASWRRALN